MRKLSISVVCAAAVGFLGCSASDPSQGDSEGPVGKVQAALVTQTDPPCYLDRIDQPNLPLDYKYSYSKAGAGVTIYVVNARIVNNGIDDFWGGLYPNAYTATGACTTDINGAPSLNMALVAGGSKYGAAKGATIKGVSVQTCINATLDSTKIVQGLTWIKNNATAPSVVVLGIPVVTSTVVAAVNALDTAGFTVIVPLDLSYPPPTLNASVIRVFETNANDVWAVDPGYNVDLRAPGDNPAEAAALVAGVAAQWLQSNPTASPSVVRAGILAQAVAIPSTFWDGAKLLQVMSL